MLFIKSIRNASISLVLILVTTGSFAKSPTPSQIERDEIFGLATLVMIYKD